MGDIFVISDLHLGDGGVRDNFEAGKKTPELRSFLDHVGSERGELFVLGDLFELWQVSLSRLFVKRREVLDHLATLPLVYVPGNHDIDLAHFIGTDFLSHPFFEQMRSPFVRTLGGKRFRFFHGHEIDPFNAGDAPGFGRMLAIFAGIFEDQNGSPFLTSGESAEDVLEQFGESMLTLWTTAMTTIGRGRAGKEMHPVSDLTPAQNPDRLSEHIRGAFADRAAHEYDVAVLGHTHKPGRIDDWYFNSGSWAGARNCFLRISPDGNVRYLEWKDGRGEEKAMPVVVPDVSTIAAARPAAKHPFEVPLAAVRTLFPRPKKPERSRAVLLLQGALALVVGIATLFVGLSRGSSEGLRLLVVAFGGYALVDGALSLYGARREPPLRALLFRTRGIAGIVLGIVVLRRGYVVEVFVILVGVWAFVTGALRVAASRVFQRWVNSRWLLIVGAGSMLGGLLLLLLPTSTTLLKYGLSAYLCYYGVSELFAGVFGQRHPPSGTAIARNGGMNTGLSRIAVVALVLSAAACSSTQKTPMVPTSSNPAAVGVVRTRQTPNENTEVRLEAQHMAPPNKVAQDAKIYVVWAKPLVEGAAPQNVGSLVIQKDRTASLETKTPLQRFDLMITPEPNGLVSQPSHEPVLKAKIVP